MCVCVRGYASGGGRPKGGNKARSSSANDQGLLEGFVPRLLLPLVPGGSYQRYMALKDDPAFQYVVPCALVWPMHRDPPYTHVPCRAAVLPSGASRQAMCANAAAPEVSPALKSPICKKQKKTWGF